MMRYFYLERLDMRLNLSYIRDVGWLNEDLRVWGME